MTDQQIADRITVVEGLLRVQIQTNRQLATEQFAIFKDQATARLALTTDEGLVTIAERDLGGAKKGNPPGSDKIKAAEDALQAAKDRRDASQKNLTALDLKAKAIDANLAEGKKLSAELTALKDEQARRKAAPAAPPAPPAFTSESAADAAAA